MNTQAHTNRFMVAAGIILLVLAAGCTENKSSLVAGSVPPALAKENLGLPTECQPTPDLPVDLARDSFAGTLLQANGLITLTIETVTWSPDPSSTSVMQPGTVIIGGKNADSESTIVVQYPTRCEVAKGVSALLQAGTTVTILTSEPSDLQVRAGQAQPKLVAAWLEKDWSRPAIAPAFGMEEFLAYSESQGQEPFDTMQVWLAAPKGEALYEEYLAFERGSPWEMTDPFIRSLDSADLPPEVLATSTPVQGLVTYSDVALEELSASENSRVVVRTQGECSPQRAF